MIKTSDIRMKILQTRKEQIKTEGFAEGIEIPADRCVPLQPFPISPVLICEIKRGSPSKGAISSIPDPAAQAEIYINGGADLISVLTEKAFFNGSLRDLIAVKMKYPGTPVLRKDFLYSMEDIEISYRIGADIVLLIASILESDQILRMYRRVKELGMEALVEVHDKLDIEKVAPFKPELIGINSRDLRDFTIDLTTPLRIKKDIKWNPKLIFESGVRCAEDARFALSSGFDGILVGESVVRKPELVSELKGAMKGDRDTNFWEKLYARNTDTPLIKICGLTRYEDVRLIDELGADILGFILAESPRQADISFLENLPPTKALKAGVVVLKTRDQKLPPAIGKLMTDGKLDVIQFHGNEHPLDCAENAFPYYKAVRLNNFKDIADIGRYRSPRILIDAFSPTAYGGTGKQIDRDLVEAVKKEYPLWLAGGIGPDNVRQLVSEFNPELIDASSSLEKSPGIKDPLKLRKFFKEIK